jgi:hypothetical protein
LPPAAHCRRAAHHRRHYLAAVGLLT